MIEKEGIQIIIHGLSALIWLVFGMIVALGVEINFRICFPLAALSIALTHLQKVFYYGAKKSE